MTETVHGLVLAGGASRRMGRPKALLEVGQETYLSRIVRILKAGGCEQIIVVTGAHHRLIAQSAPIEADVIYAPEWHLGMRSSLRAGIAAAASGSLLITHVDRPAVSVKTVRALVEAAGSMPLIPTFRACTGHPIIIPQWLRANLLDRRSEPLRAVLRRSGIRRLPVEDPGILANINTPFEHGYFRSRTDKYASGACIPQRRV